MSFSNELKNRIIRDAQKRPDCFSSVVSGILYSASKFIEDGEFLSVSTENSSLIKFLIMASRLTKDYTGNYRFVRKKLTKTRARYNIKFTKPYDLLSIYNLDISDLHDFDVQIKRDYLLGLFLGSASIADPAKTYHIEFLCKNKDYSEKLMDLLSELSIPSKYIKRSSSWVVYIKDRDIISDFLSLIGADTERFIFEETKLRKDIHNMVNRQLNCDYANIQRVTLVSERQLDAIKLIKDTKGLNFLSDKLKEAAELRLKYPELSLLELGQKADPPISKSGINHRLNRIEKIASKIFLEGK